MHGCSRFHGERVNLLPEFEIWIFSSNFLGGWQYGLFNIFIACRPTNEVHPKMKWHINRNQHGYHFTKQQWSSLNHTRCFSTWKRIYCPVVIILAEILIAHKFVLSMICGQFSIELNRNKNVLTECIYAQRKWKIMESRRQKIMENKPKCLPYVFRWLLRKQTKNAGRALNKKWCSANGNSRNGIIFFYIRLK